MIIDVACPVDSNLILKRKEKLYNYSELQLPLTRIWYKETCIVPIILWALGSIPKDKDIYVKKPDTSFILSNLQKTVILGYANLLRKIKSPKWNIKCKTKGKIQKLNKKVGGGGIVCGYKK